MRRPRRPSKKVSQRMKRVRTVGTLPEFDLWRALAKLTRAKFEVDTRPEPDVNRRADLIFRRRRLAVFVDGCFWHGCPRHYSTPRRNAAWWTDKIERNRRRDKQTSRLLRRTGWTVVRVWEHEEPSRAAARIVKKLRV
ncbi:hypothetical protein LCGC14_2642350 [marine sediment metagenome]|uniref:DUF559 domain-containing protein n=1 Tax=marine sediment metagenome TaxID=412755 RepID=A0A0F8ZXC2_9ZZZZ